MKNIILNYIIHPKPPKCKECLHRELSCPKPCFVNIILANTVSSLEMTFCKMVQSEQKSKNPEQGDFSYIDVAVQRFLAMRQEYLDSIICSEFPPSQVINIRTY